MSNIIISARDIRINVRNDNGEQVLGFNLPAYELEVAPEGLLSLIDNIDKMFRPKKVEAKQANDEAPPTHGETYYITSECGIDVED